MSITLKELAKAAGVSEATASLAMNDRPGVSPSTKASIRLLAEKLGYHFSHVYPVYEIFYPQEEAKP